MKDYYKILGVDRKASGTEIKKQFRIRALSTHPDKTNRDTKIEFLEVYEAYVVLSDKKRKKNYDGLYDLFFQSQVQVKADELKIDLTQIDERGKVYAENFGVFNKEILRRLLLELFFSVDDLLFASAVATFFGLWTIGRGLLTLDFGYAIVGLILTLIGLFFGKLKINSVIRSDY